MPATTATAITPYTKTAGSGNEIEPNVDRPAHTRNSNISRTCMRKPATVSRPTLDTATALSTPAFWRKRVLSAIPPLPAGASVVVNDVASWAQNVGSYGSRFGTEPASASAAAT